MVMKMKSLDHLLFSLLWNGLRATSDGARGGARPPSTHWGGSQATPSPRVVAMGGDTPNPLFFSFLFCLFFKKKKKLIIILILIFNILKYCFIKFVNEKRFQ